MQGNSAECGEMPDQVSKSHGTKCVTGSMEPVTNIEVLYTSYQGTSDEDGTRCKLGNMEPVTNR